MSSHRSYEILTSENLVGVRGFEPPTPASRRQCSTRLSYTPTVPREIVGSICFGKGNHSPLGIGLICSLWPPHGRTDAQTAGRYAS